MSIKKKWILNILLLCLSATQSLGDDTLSGPSPIESLRMTKRLGAYYSLYGDPYPATSSINLFYNMTDYLRLNIGSGIAPSACGLNTSSGTLICASQPPIIGGGIKFLLPKNNLTPIVGLNFGQPISGNWIYSSFYLNAGVDWIHNSGFLLDAGINFFSNYTSTVSPYLNVGFAF